MSNSLNLPEIDQEQALHLSKFFVRSHQNLFLFGRRGVGKTHIALQAATECNYKINYINLSVIERPDLAGYPDINSPGDIITFKSPSFLPKLLQNDQPDNIILFDEVDKAPPEVTAPLLEILQFRAINGTPINVAGCILTGNLSNEGAYSNQISSALLDRGAKYILSFNFEKWIDWAKINSVHDLILGFLRSNPEFACGKLEDSCYASPSPRGWTMASEALIKARDLKIIDIETITQIVSGFVGNEAGIRFKIWYEHYRKFEPFIHNLIEAGSMSFNFHELEPTAKVVFVIGVCHYAKQKSLSEPARSKNRFVYLENLCKFFINHKVDHELQVMGLYNSFDFDMIAKHKLYACKEFFDLFTRITEKSPIKK
jgi:MoxR-like ATPases